MNYVVNQEDLRAGLKANLGRRRYIDLTGIPMWVYGNSQATIPGYANLVGQEWPTRVKQLTGAPSVTSYAINGTRIQDGAFAAIGTGTGTGSTAPVAGSLWPGVSARQGIVFADFMYTDVIHHAVAGALGTPVAIPITDTKYRDSTAASYRTLMAALSSESRIEHASSTMTGTWASQNIALGGSSGGFAAYSLTVGAVATYTVTPPQTGPFAGRVWYLAYSVDPSVGVNAQHAVSIDGALNYIHQPVTWEMYQGFGAVNMTAIQYVIPIDLPIDGNSHTVAIQHTGPAGAFMYNDCILIPSVNPNPVVVLEATWANTGAWTAPQVAIWRQNLDLLYPPIRDAVAEFPNTIWASSSITSNGLYVTDGVHLNDRGHNQRANDVLDALIQAEEWIRNKQLELLADTNFGVI